MKITYIKPEIETIVLSTEGIIATSGPDSAGVDNSDEYTGPSFSRKNFWGSGN